MPRPKAETTSTLRPFLLLYLMSDTSVRGRVVLNGAHDPRFVVRLAKIPVSVPTSNAPRPAAAPGTNVMLRMRPGPRVKRLPVTFVQLAAATPASVVRKTWDPSVMKAVCQWLGSSTIPTGDPPGYVALRGALSGVALPAGRT